MLHDYVFKILASLQKFLIQILIEHILGDATSSVSRSRFKVYLDVQFQGAILH
jgi:hypothetical protein